LLVETDLPLRDLELRVRQPIRYPPRKPDAEGEDQRHRKDRHWNTSRFDGLANKAARVSRSAGIEQRYA